MSHEIAYLVYLLNAHLLSTAVGCARFIIGGRFVSPVLKTTHVMANSLIQCYILFIQIFVWTFK
jgi:hypothetical protein